MDEKKLHRVLACIEQRLPQSIRVEELAKEAQMSPFHFARTFKKAVGHPPHAYITHLRMERAKAFLAEGKLSLREIARAVGFQTQAHFSGVFHKRVGMTPRTYRLRHLHDGAHDPAAAHGAGVAPIAASREAPPAVAFPAAHARETSPVEPS